MSESLFINPMPLQSYNFTQKIDRLKSAVGSSNSAPSKSSHSDLKKACIEFESIFVAYLMKEMRSTIPKSGLISGGKAEEIYTSMLDSELAKEIALNGGIGLSTRLYEQLSEKFEDTKSKAEKVNNGLKI